MATENPATTLNNLSKNNKKIIRPDYRDKKDKNLFCEDMKGNSNSYIENHEKVNWDRPKDMFEESRDSKGKLIITIKKG